MRRSEAIEIALSILSALLFLIALPMALLALVGIDKLITPTQIGHLTLEILLIVAVVAGLVSPFAIRGPITAIQVRAMTVNTAIVALAIASLFSPLFKGFLH